MSISTFCREPIYECVVDVQIGLGTCWRDHRGEGGVEAVVESLETVNVSCNADAERAIALENAHFQGNKIGASIQSRAPKVVIIR